MAEETFHPSFLMLDCLNSFSKRVIVALSSCKAAVKAGREYAPEQIKWIVDKLMELPDITFCPHGRPVAMEMKT